LAVVCHERLRPTQRRPIGAERSERGEHPTVGVDLEVGGLDVGQPTQRLE
jgi:hypothetical protein